MKITVDAVWVVVLTLQKRLNELIASGGGAITDLTGDVSATGPGSAVATITADAVSNAKLANMAQATFKMRAAGSGTGDPIDGTAAQAKTALGIVATCGITIDGGGAALTTGIKGDLEIPVACTITAVRMFADQSGSAVVDLWKDTYANYPPTVADTITASAKPTISGATKSQDTTLTGWTTALAAGDTLRFNLDSCTSITRLQLQLTVVLA